MRKNLPANSFNNLRPPDRTGYKYFEDFQNNLFHHDATGFDLLNAAWLMDFALLAYDDETNIKKIFERPDFTGADFVFKFFGANESECFVAHNDKFVVVAFRGSELNNFWGVIMDWTLDFEALPVAEGSDGLVHVGFQRGVDRVWPAEGAQAARTELQDYLTQLMSDGAGRTLWITGQSLGGALATLAAKRIARAGFDVRGVYTYGSPRVGDNQFKQAYAQLGLAERTYRFVNNEDVVTKVPPPPLYTHVGQLKFINAAGLLQELADEAAAGVETHLPAHAQAALRQLLSLGQAGFKLLADTLEGNIPQPFADHAPVCYSCRIWNNLP